jgi:flagellar M-ring protein FliF
VEASHLKRVLDLLEPVVGRDNVRASVTAEIDFSQVMPPPRPSPNQGDGRRPPCASCAPKTNQPGTATPSGVPGATSNQPPVPATAPINGQAQPLQARQAAAAGWQRRREAPPTTKSTRPPP